MITCADILAAATGVATTDLVGACLQADAAIKAARIQAKAATDAGWLTVGTAVTALAAAYIAYLAAGRQVRLTERQYQAKGQLYAALIYHVVNEIRDGANAIYGFAFSVPTVVTDEQDIDFAILTSYVISDDSLADQHWERHSMLSPEVAVSIIDVYRKGRTARTLIDSYGRERKRYWLDIRAGKTRADNLLSEGERLIRDSALALRDSADRAIEGLKRYMQKS